MSESQEPETVLPESKLAQLRVACEDVKKKVEELKDLIRLTQKQLEQAQKSVTLFERQIQAEVQRIGERK
jgi:predicted  nucleic acid-binding Zn-ribbon protein